MPGFSPTQGHIASAVPFLGHALRNIMSGKIQNAMFLAKGSLFLGRMTQLSDGISFLLERNKGGEKMEAVIGVTAILFVFLLILVLTSAKTVRPTERGLVERWGRYRRFANPGLQFVAPFWIDKLYRVNITEQMVSSEKREIITADSLNAIVDSNVYFKVKDNEQDVKASIYNVNNYSVQIVALAKTTLRNIIGTLTLKSANSERGKINAELHKTLCEETIHWGIEIVRTELKEIDPPKDVQETMNKVVKAEPIIGKFILDSLAIGMYNDPLMIFREYQILMFRLWYINSIDKYLGTYIGTGKGICRLL
jgi:hypothetical protein